jgi:hypothetical protein
LHSELLDNNVPFQTVFSIKGHYVK